MKEAEKDVKVDKFAGMTEGRIVHYVMPNEEHRPAIIVRVWDRDHVNGCCNLQVFTDGPNDLDQYVEQRDGNSRLERLEDARGGVMWRTSVVYSEKTVPNTWHWVEKA